MEANALVFHTSLSVFDQFLEDDRRINRLEDAYKFWTVICESSFISKMQLILILSGCDNLRIKLEQGALLKRYIPSYGNRPNDLNAATKYFRDSFQAISRKYAVGRRLVYSHLISSAAPDKHGVRAVIISVRDGIFRDSLRTADLI